YSAERTVTALESIGRLADPDYRPVLWRSGLLEYGESEADRAWSAVAPGRAARGQRRSETRFASSGRSCTGLHGKLADTICSRRWRINSTAPGCCQPGRRLPDGQWAAAPPDQADGVGATPARWHAASRHPSLYAADPR